jgi:hypothetical protein
MYIVRFDSMRSMYRASRWAEVMSSTNNSIFNSLSHLRAQEAKQEAQKDGDSHILERLGPARATSHLVRLVSPRLRSSRSCPSFVWRSGTGETYTPLSLCIGITCQVFSELRVLCARPPHVQKLQRGRAQCACRAAPWRTCSSSLRPRARNGCAVAIKCVRERHRVLRRAPPPRARAGIGGVGRVMASLRRKPVRLGTRSIVEYGSQAGGHGGPRAVLVELYIQSFSISWFSCKDKCDIN